MKSSPQRGIQSVEKGIRLLKILAQHRRPMPLGSLATSAKMPASIAHRYLVSFIREGVVEQTSDGCYDLGAFLLRAGLSKLSRLDSYRVGLSYLDKLSKDTGETVAMMAWNGHSPVVIRWIEADRPVNVYVRPGSVLPTIASASGRVFAAYLPSHIAAEAIDQEFRSGMCPTLDGKRLDREEFRVLLETIRKRGMARIRSDFTPGIDALAAPVFDHQKNIVFVFSVLGPSGSFDTTWSASIAESLREAAAQCSLGLGASALDLEPNAPKN